ncbi:MAG: hypothetical protein J6W06_05630 [Bacteroidales bacterium]|nr:hypothetical protein [Bacteroidales bacterium]
MKNDSIKRNAPIAQLIKDYSNKKSGKVSESRKEIQWRFKYLDWKDQKKIILAFLDSGKTDKQWAYSMALDLWDKSFEPKIKEIWEKFHEEKCSWIAIRYLPSEYISENIEKFTHKRNYFFICMRLGLANDKNFVIEKDKLSNNDYLAIIYHSGRSLKEDEGRDILYNIIHDMCLDNDNFSLDMNVYNDDVKVITPVLFQEVSLALYYLNKLNCQQTIQEFYNWNDIVAKNIYNSQEFKSLDKEDHSFRYLCMNVAKKYAYLALDNKYKKPSYPSVEDVLKPEGWYSIVQEQDPTLIEKERQAFKEEKLLALEEIKEHNPNVGKLISNMELEISDDFPTFPPYKTSKDIDTTDVPF